MAANLNQQDGMGRAVVFAGMHCDELLSLSGHMLTQSFSGPQDSSFLPMHTFVHIHISLRLAPYPESLSFFEIDFHIAQTGLKFIATADCEPPRSITIADASCIFLAGVSSVHSGKPLSFSRYLRKAKAAPKLSLV